MGLTHSIGRRIGGKAGEKALDELSARLAGVTRGAVDTAVRTRGVHVAADVDVFRVERRDLTGVALERALIRSRARRGAVTGLASGLPSVAVGLGTAIEVAAAVADAALVTYAEVSLVLGLCHLRGRDVAEIEPRRLDVLLVLGLQAGAVKRDNGVLRIGDRVIEVAEIDDLDDEVVGRVNRELGERIVAKIARRRAAAIAGRLVPLGIGVAVAGLEDYRSVGAVGRSAIVYLDLVEAAQDARASARRR